MTDNRFYWDADLHRQIAELGAELGPRVRDATIDLYSSVYRGTPEEKVIRDISYGPDSRHRLDVHQPLGVDADLCPIFCFVHGGGFIGGDKTKTGQPYYDNVGAWAATCGYLGVNVTYRFAPQFTYPAGSEDVASALAWIDLHALDFGGDNTRVVVMGHSSGAAHVATCIASPEIRTNLHSLPVGAILSSGVYDPSIGPNTYAPYYGEDQSELTSRSSIQGLCDADVPLLISTTEFDPVNTQMQTLELIGAFGRRHGKFPDFIQADGHNHYSVMYQFGTKETWFTDRLQRFVESLPRSVG
jgi:triacylglycerol lipase